MKEKKIIKEQNIVKEHNSNDKNSSNIFSMYKNINQRNNLQFYLKILNKYKKIKTGISTNSTNFKNFQYIQAIQKTLDKKYNVNKIDYDLFIVESLIYNKNCHLVSIFKEYMIIDYIDEFLKRVYKSSECLERIPKFANYYKNYLKFFCNPIFRDFKVNSIIQSHGDNKAELYYNRNYGNKKKSNPSPFNNINTIFNTTVKKNIDKYSITQNTIRQDLLEVSIRNEVYKPNTNIKNFQSAKQNALENRNFHQNINMSMDFNIVEDFNNINLNSFIDRSGFSNKISKEESLLNIVLNLNKMKENKKKNEIEDKLKVKDDNIKLESPKLSILNKNTNTITLTKSPNDTKLNLKNFNIIKPQNFKNGHNYVHVKNVYSSEFTNNGDMNPLILSNQFKTIAEKDKIINNSNLINSSRVICKLSSNVQPSLTSHLIENNKYKRIISKEKSIINAFKIKNLTNKIENKTEYNSENKNENKNSVNSNYNSNYLFKKSLPGTITNTINHKNSQKSYYSPNHNNLMDNPSNDIMKITLSLYMDKTERNRLSTQLEPSNTQNILGSNLLKTTNSNNFNNFNININNQINISETPLEKPSIKLNGFKDNSNVNKISSDFNSNLKKILEKNKNLSRNKNHSLCKFSSNQAKSNTIQDIEDNVFQTTKAISKNYKKNKIYGSLSNLRLENRQLFYSTKNETNDGLKNNPIIKQTFDNYNSYHKKSQSHREDIKSPSKISSDICSSRNKKFVESNKIVVQSERKVPKINLNNKLIKNLVKQGLVYTNTNNDKNKANALNNPVNRITKTYLNVIKK